MERESKQSSPVDRTRYLNIVYFVESARSHTIRVNLKYARWGLGLTAIIGSWAIGSIVWILSLQVQVTQTRERLETSLTTIFDYQIKNDKVFDLAYPADATNSYYSESAHLASNNPLVDQGQAKQDPSLPAQKSTITVAAVPAATKNAEKISEKQQGRVSVTPSDKNLDSGKEAKEAQNFATAAETGTGTTTSKPKSTDTKSDDFIEITAAKISKTGNKIDVVFDINNLQEEKADGYVWAVATFTNPDGTFTYVGAPQTAKLDPATGQITSAKSGYRFSIQRYKKKDFEFNTPSTKNWKLSKLTINYTDINRKNESQINIPVDQLALTEQSDQAPTMLKF